MTTVLKNGARIKNSNFKLRKHAITNLPESKDDSSGDVCEYHAREPTVKLNIKPLTPSQQQVKETESKSKLIKEPVKEEKQIANVLLISSEPNKYLEWAKTFLSFGSKLYINHTDVNVNMNELEIIRDFDLSNINDIVTKYNIGNVLLSDNNIKLNIGANINVTYTPNNYKFETDSTIIIKTFNRPDCIKKLVTTIRSYYKQIQILILDDGYQKYNISEFLKKYNNIDYIQTKFDIGASAGRNLLVDLVKTKYLITCDDDFIFTKDTDLNLLFEVINNNNLDILAGYVSGSTVGKLFSIDNNNLIYIKDNKGPIIYNNKIIGHYYDYVCQFYIAKTDVIKKIKWDGSLKTGEHADFFIKAKSLNVKTGMIPLVIVEHNKEHNSDKDYEKFRRRGFETFIHILMKKYNIKKIIDGGSTVTYNPNYKKLI